MGYMEVYNEWLNNAYFDESTREELKEIKNNKEEIEDRFYKELEFGTAGLRGKIAAGTNRMNLYIIRRATQGLAYYIKDLGEDYIKRGVAIAYDCRHFSKEFAKNAALVLAANGIKAYLFEDLRPTPELSYTVIKLKTAAGIVVTASHNPKEYNGYKVYGENGAQILSDAAEAITEKISSIKRFEDVKIISEEEAKSNNLLEILGKEIDDQYMEKVKALSIRNSKEELDKDIKVVYTPLNGTGNIPVRRILKERGFNNIEVVKEQENPDGDFPTIEYPNPEDIRAFEYSKKLGKKIGAEILIATDPDCDRLALMVRDKNGEYVSFNGNQTGAILIKYILEGRKEKGILSEKGILVKSIVTGDLGKVIAKNVGVKTFECLTGFKNICGTAVELEKTKGYKFEFGYEESIGYTTGDFVRDKDGVISSMFLCEAAAYYKKQGKTLLDVLNDIFKEYGYYKEHLTSIVLEGIEGSKRIKRMMESYRKDYPKAILESKLVKYIDYREGTELNLETSESSKTSIPKSNVLKFIFDDNSWYALRPSGTEPKIKLYIYVNNKNENKAVEKLEAFKDTISKILNSIE
ncbi:phospho-sugar mutase [Clostridium oceanicum]|uniref:Phosphoglucomutase n=1 Tax=Clostridium oceanicum TaxID=1543 RepID=A0ABP3URK0_9CLOT